MELTINGRVYEFRAGFGFLRDVNKLAQREVEGTKKKKDIGLQMLVADLMDGDAEALLHALDMLNKGMDPRVTQKDLEDYLEDDDTDVDSLFEKVLDFLANSNVTGKEVKTFIASVTELLENQKKQ